MDDTAKAELAELKELSIRQQLARKIFRAQFGDDPVEFVDLNKEQREAFVRSASAAQEFHGDLLRIIHASAEASVNDAILEELGRRNEWSALSTVEMFDRLAKIYQPLLRILRGI
jgi:hypothetical protein